MGAVRRKVTRRRVAALFYAVALGAYLTLGDLKMPGDSAVGDDGYLNGYAYLAVSAAGIAGLVVLVGVHAAWLVPVATLLFAQVYEGCCWNAPQGIPSGIESLGYQPRDVIFYMGFAIPFALAVAAARWGLRRFATLRRADPRLR